MALLQVPPGVLIEPLGDGWGCYSPSSGETHLLNHEAAALLEILIEQPQTLDQVAEVMARESDCAVQDVLPLLEDSVPDLTYAGLLRVVQATASSAPA